MTTEPFDFERFSRRMRMPGASYWPENWPKILRDKWLRDLSEDHRTRWLAEHGEWLVLVDRYYTELNRRRAATYLPSPAFSKPAEPVGDDPECE